MAVSVPWRAELDAVILCDLLNEDLEAEVPLALQTRALLAVQSWRIGEVYFSTGRHQARFDALGLPTLADNFPESPGALAGIEAALSTSDADCMLAVPSARYLLPSTLGSQLAKALQRSGAAVAYAVVDGRAEFSICLIARHSLPSIRHWLRSGSGGLAQWAQQEGAVGVAIPGGWLC